MQCLHQVEERELNSAKGIVQLEEQYMTVTTTTASLQEELEEKDRESQELHK